MNPRKQPNGLPDTFGWAGFLASGLLVVGLVFGIWTAAEAVFFWKDGRDVPYSFYLVRGVVSTVLLMSWAASRVFRERRRHERLAEQNSAAYFRSMLDNMTDGAVMMGEDSRINYASPSAEVIFGYSREELLGRDVSILMPEPHRSAHAGYVRRYLATGERKILGVKARELEGVRKSGDPFPLELTVEEVRLEGRRMFVGFIRDLRDKIWLEEERVRRSKLESLSVLAGGLAHDFNNFLQAILGNLGLAKAEAGENTSLRELLLDAESVSRRAQGLTRQLLTFARGGAPVLKTSELAPIIEETARFALHGSAVTARFDLARNLAPADVDAGQIGQVIQNLVINAVQAMPGRGQVTIAADNVRLGPDEIPPLTEGAYIWISVEDTGVGIAPEHLPKIFDPYFTTKEIGSGLGLASSLSIVRRHGGTIRAYSEPGLGSRFTMHIPASHSKVEIEKDVPAPAGWGRVLVMDDDEAIQRVAARMLRSLGFEVVAAPDGEAAVGEVREALRKGSPFRAILMDLTVVGGSGGREAVQRVRELDPNARVVVSSGYSNDPIMANYKEHGFSACLPKPYTLEELGRVLSEVLEAASDDGQAS